MVRAENNERISLGINMYDFTYGLKTCPSNFCNYFLLSRVINPRDYFEAFLAVRKILNKLKYGSKKKQTKYIFRSGWGGICSEPSLKVFAAFFYRKKKLFQSSWDSCEQI